MTNDTMIDIETLGPSLCALRVFVAGRPVWGNGATFDISILEHLGHMFNCGELFAHNQSRDVRTVVDLGQMRGVDFKSDPKMWEGCTHHNALDDAIAQARYTAATIRSLTA